MPDTPEQKDLVNALLQASRPLIAVAVRESYDIASCIAAPALLALLRLQHGVTAGAVPLRLRPSADR